jgi:hypothetical protein
MRLLNHLGSLQPHSLFISNNKFFNDYYFTKFFKPNKSNESEKRKV